MSHEQSGLGLALLAHVGDQVQLEDDVVGVVGLELVVVLNLEYGNLLRGIDNCLGEWQRYTVLQTIQMKLMLLCVWAERAVLDSTKTALKFKYEIQIG